MTETIFAIEQVGRLGNHMLQYMFARAVQHYARRPVRIVGADMPVWGVSARDPAPDAAAPRIGGHLLSARWIASAIDRHTPPRLRMNNLCFRVGNFLPASGYAQDFPLVEGEGRTPPADALLIHVRAGDIVSDVHPNYGPLPFSYYRHVIQETGLAPIFIGELKTEPYASALRNAFPEAEFWDDGSPIEDFQTMRRAKHLAISVSTFGWLAAFFSQADRIHMPIAGFLDPRTGRTSMRCRLATRASPIGACQKTYGARALATSTERALHSRRAASLGCCVVARKPRSALRRGV